MERINTLIDKLAQQKAQSAPPSHLLFTVQLLHQELLQLQGQTNTSAGRRVSVTLPVSLNFSEESLRVPYGETVKEKEVFALEVSQEEVLVTVEPEVFLQSAPEPKEYSLRKPALAEAFYTQEVQKEEPKVSAQPSYFNMAFETLTEAPTLPVFERRELHHVIAAESKESLNDRLKEQRTEVAHLLKETPIKDLRKAIGINDRFVFVRELFRGDDAAYERSVKTINGFNIYSEAEYWIARELKHKMGWEDANATVSLFYQLVRRRFS